MAEKHHPASSLRARRRTERLARRQERQRLEDEAGKGKKRNKKAETKTVRGVVKRRVQYRKQADEE